MKTVYINLNAVPMEGNGMVQQASGGQGPVCRAVVVPARPAAPAGGQRGKVLDFAACRQALAEKAPQPEHRQPEQPDSQPAPRRWSVGLILDVAVSGAVLFLVAATAAQYFLH